MIQGIHYIALRSEKFSTTSVQRIISTLFIGLNKAFVKPLFQFFIIVLLLFNFKDETTNSLDWQTRFTQANSHN